MNFGLVEAARRAARMDLNYRCDLRAILTWADLHA
jgi:hypothetical protein